MDFSDIVETPTQPKPYWQTLDEYRKAASEEPEIAKMTVPQYAAGINQLVGYPEHQENIQDNALRRGGVNLSNLTRHFGGFDPGSTLDKLGVPSPSKLLGGPQEGVDLPGMAHRGAASLATSMGAGPGVSEAVGKGGEQLVGSLPVAAAGLIPGVGIPAMAGMAALQTYGETGSKLQSAISGTGAALIPKFMEGAGQAALRSFGAKTVGELRPELANLLEKGTAATTEKLAKFAPSGLVERGAEFGAKQAGLTANILGTQAAETAVDPTLSWEDKLKNIGSEFSPSNLIATGIGQLPFTAMDLVHARTRPLDIATKNVEADFGDRFSKAYQEGTGEAPTNKEVQSTIDRLKTGKVIPPESTVGKVLESIGQVPVEADLKTPIHTSEGSWNPIEAIETTRAKANRMLMAQGMADPDNPPITSAHDPTLAYVLRGIDAKTLSKDDLAHLAASNVADHWAGDREMLKQSGYVPDADFPRYGQGTTPERRFASYQKQSGVSEKIATLTDPESKLYDRDTAIRMALVEGSQEDLNRALEFRKPSGELASEGLIPQIQDSVKRGTSEFAPELTPELEQQITGGGTKPLLTNIINRVSGLGPSASEREAAIRRRIDAEIAQHGIYAAEFGGRGELERLRGELMDLKVQHRTGLETGTRNVGAPSGDATFAARKAALDYNTEGPGSKEPFDIKDPKSVTRFVNWIGKAIKQAEKNAARIQLEEPAAKDVEGKAIRFPTKALAEEYANDPKNQPTGADQFNVQLTVPSLPENDGTWRVNVKRNVSLFGLPDVERESRAGTRAGEQTFEERLEAGSEEDTTEKPLIEEEAVPEGTTFDALSEAVNTVSRRITELNKHNDPAVVEGRKAAMVKNFSDFMQVLPEATFRDIWKAGTGKRIQEIDQWKKRFIRYVQFLGYGGDVTVKKEDGRLKGVGNLEGLNKFMQELGFGKYPTTHPRAGEERADSWNRAVGGTNFFEKFALVTNFANRYMVDPKTAIPDPEHRPIGDYGWLTPEFRRDLDKKVVVNWTDLPKTDVTHFRPGVLNRDGTEYRSDLAGVTDKPGTIKVSTGQPLADMITKMTQHDLVMKASDVVKWFKQLGGVDTALAEELMRRLPFVGKQNVGFSITRDPLNRGYFHTDNAISSAGVLADPYVFNARGKLELMHPRDIFPIIMEELGHSGVDFAWNTNPEFKADVQRAYDHVKGHLDDLVKIGAEGKFAQLGLTSLRNPQEMLAGMFKDPNLHEFLKGIDDPEPFYQSGVQRSVFDKLYNMIKDLFTKWIGPIGANTMLARVASLTSRAVEIQKGMPLVNRGDIYQELYDRGLLSGERLGGAQPEPVPKPTEPTQVYRDWTAHKDVYPPKPGPTGEIDPKAAYLWEGVLRAQTALRETPREGVRMEERKDAQTNLDTIKELYRQYVLGESEGVTPPEGYKPTFKPSPYKFEGGGKLPNTLQPVRRMLEEDVERDKMNLSYAQQDQFSPQGGDVKIAQARLQDSTNRLNAFDQGQLNVADIVDSSAVKDRESYVSDLQTQLIHTQGMQLSDPAAKAQQIETITRLTNEIKRNNELIVQLTKLQQLKEGQVLESREVGPQQKELEDIVGTTTLPSGEVLPYAKVGKTSDLLNQRMYGIQFTSPNLVRARDKEGGQRNFKSAHGQSTGLFYSQHPETAKMYMSRTGKRELVNHELDPNAIGFMTGMAKDDLLIDFGLMSEKQMGALMDREPQRYHLIGDKLLAQFFRQHGIDYYTFDDASHGRDPEFVVLNEKAVKGGGQVLESRTEPTRVIDAMKASSLYLTEDRAGDLWFKPYNVKYFRDTFGPAFGDKLRLTENNGQWGYSIRPSEAFNLTQNDVARMPVPRMKPWAPSIFETMKGMFKQQGANDETAEALAGYNMQFASLLKGSEGVLWGQLPSEGEAGNATLGTAWGYWKHAGLMSAALEDYTPPETTIRHEATHVSGFHDLYKREPRDVRLAMDSVNQLFTGLSEDQRKSLMASLVNTTNYDYKTRGSVYEASLTNPSEFAAEVMAHVGDVIADVPKPSAYLREMMRFVPDEISKMLQLSALRRTQGLERLQFMLENNMSIRGIKSDLYTPVKEVAEVFKDMSRSALEIAEDQSEFYRTRMVYPDTYRGFLQELFAKQEEFGKTDIEPTPRLQSTLLESRMPPPIENMIRKFFNYPTSDGNLPSKLSLWDKNLMQFPQFALKYPSARSFVDMFTKADVMRKTFRTQNQVALAGAYEGNRIYDDVRTKQVAQFYKSPTMQNKLSKIALELNVLGDFKYGQEEKAVGGDENAMDPTKLLNVTPQLTKGLMDKHGVTDAERPTIQTVLDGLRNQYIHSSGAIVKAHQHELETMLAMGVARNTDLLPEAARSTALLLSEAVQKQATDTPAAVQALAQFQQAVPDTAVFQRLLDAAQKGWQNIQRLDRAFQMRSPYVFSEIRPGKYGLVWKDEKGNVQNRSFVDAKSRDSYVVNNKIKPERQTNPDSVAGINPNLMGIIDEIHQQTVERARNLFGEDEAERLGRLADFSTDLRDSLNQNDILKESLGRKLQPGRDELNMFDTSQHYFNAMSNAVMKRFIRREAELLFTSPEFANEPEIKAQIQGQIEAFMKPDTTTGSFMRNIGFMYYLWGNISSMIMQTSHQVMGLAPMLTRQGESVAGSFNMIRKANQAVIEAKRGGYKDPVLRDMVTRLKADQGIQSWISRETDYNPDLSLINRIRGTSGKPLWEPFDLAKNKLYQAINLGRRMYDIVPNYNSEVAFVASVMHLKSRKAEFGGPLSGDQLYKEATFLRQNTMYTGGKENRPGFFQWMPRSAAQGLWSLQTYANGLTTEMGELIRRSFNPKGMTPAQTRQVRKAAAQMLITQTAVSGVLGLPFATIALTALQKLFPEMNIEGDIREALASLAGDDDAMGSFLSNAATMGVPSAMDYSPDLGSRFALHGVFHVSPYGDVGWDQLLGPSGGILTNVLKGAQAGLEGRPLETVQSLMPVGFRRVWQSLEQGQTYKTQSGRIMADDLGPEEVVARMIGFRPARVRRIEDFERLNKVSESAAQEEQSAWTKKQVNLLKSGDDGAVRQNIAQRVADKKGVYPAKKLSNDVQEEYERQTTPVDTRKFGNRATVEAQRSLRGTLGTQTEGPSNTERLQLQQQIAARLGIGGPSTSRFRHAAGVDQLLQRYPHLTTPQASLLLNHAAGSRPSQDLYQELLEGGQ